jgi:hypothetical protein
MVADPEDIVAHLVGSDFGPLEASLEDDAHVEEALEHSTLDDRQMPNTPLRHLSKHILNAVLKPAESEISGHDGLDRHGGRALGELADRAADVDYGYHPEELFAAVAH